MQRTLVPLVFAAALGACVAQNGDEGIFVTKNAAPGDGCTFTSDPNEQFVSHGTIDMRAPQGYQMHPQMQSRITATDANFDARTILMRGGRVDLDFVSTDATGNKLFTDAELATMKMQGLTHFEQLFSAPLRPNGGIADGHLEVLPVATLEAIAAKAPAGQSFRTEVVAKVTVFGDMSGTEITSQEFQFPITVCNDCVLNVLQTTDGTALTCPLPAGTVVAPGNSCNQYQDGVVDCCTSPGGLICPGTIAPPAP